MPGALQRDQREPVGWARCQAEPALSSCLSACSPSCCPRGLAAGTGTGSWAECNSWQSWARADSVAALIPIHTALPLFIRAGGWQGGRLFMLALKPGLFPLPRLRCLLFLQAAFHRGFNSLQTLPNGFFTWGLRAGSGFQKFHAPPTPPPGH